MQFTRRRPKLRVSGVGFHARQNTVPLEPMIPIPLNRLAISRTVDKIVQEKHVLDLILLHRSLSLTLQ